MLCGCPERSPQPSRGLGTPCPSSPGNGKQLEAALDSPSCSRGSGSCLICMSCTCCFILQGNPNPLGPLSTTSSPSHLFQAQPPLPTLGAQTSIQRGFQSPPALPPGAGGAITHLLRVPSPCRPGLRTTRVKDGTRVCVELQPDYRATGAEGCGQQGGETRRGGGQEGGGTRAAPRQEVLTRKPGAGSGMIHRTP